MDNITKMLANDAAIFEMNYSDPSEAITLEKYEAAKLHDYLTSAIRVANSRLSVKSRGHIRLAIRKVGTTNSTGRTLDRVENCFAAFSFPKRAMETAISGRIKLPPTWDELEESHENDRPITRSIAFMSIGVVWKYYPASCDVVGFIWYEDDKQQSQVQTILSCLRERPHPMPHPAVFSLAVITSALEYLETKVVKIRTELYDLENKTWLAAHPGAKAVIPRDTDLDQLSAKISGLSCNCLGHQRRLAQYADICRGLIGDCESGNFEAVDFHDDRAHNYFELQARHMCLWCDDMLEYVKTASVTLSVVAQGVVNQIAQRDSHASLEMARGSKPDSTTMKAITILVMIFLPGTFIASLLAMPFFSVDNNTGAFVARKQWIFWAITVPLTIVVVCIWLIWERVSRRRGDAGLRMADRKNDKAV